MEYLDFEITVHEARGRDYRVSVRSPAGDGNERVRFSRKLKTRREALDKDWIDHRSSRDIRAQAANEGNGHQAAREFGRALFDTVLGGELGKLYAASLDRARQSPDGGLRIKILTQGRELTGLPWELLLDPGRDDFLCLSNSTPLVRYLEASHPPVPLGVTPPLRVLGMVANPRGLPALDVDREKALVENAVAGLRAKGSLQIEWVKEQTWQALAMAVGDSGGGPWHIFHFIGHGGVNPHTNEGHIALATEQGDRNDLTAEALCRLLGDNRDLRLVVLNTCEGARDGSDLLSSMAATLVRRSVPAVVAMQHKISDEAAIEFASVFYRTLAVGSPVDGAVAEARKVLSLAFPQALEWATPVLHMRSPDGKLFRLEERTTQEDGVIPATPAVLALPDKADFGVVLKGDSPFIPVTVKNARGGSLKWDPYPTGDFFKANKVGDLLGIRLNDDVRPGNHKGSVKIVSDGGITTIGVRATVGRWLERVFGRWL